MNAALHATRPVGAPADRAAEQRGDIAGHPAQMRLSHDPLKISAYRKAHNTDQGGNR